jgi:hypothetical protein
MKPKLRYNRNYTVTLIPESRSRKLEEWSTTAALAAVAIAVFALLANPTPRAIVETDSVVMPTGIRMAGSGTGS